MRAVVSVYTELTQTLACYSKYIPLLFCTLLSELILSFQLISDFMDAYATCSAYALVRLFALAIHQCIVAKETILRLSLSSKNLLV